MTKCPHCGGKGYGVGFICGPTGDRFGKIKCADCDGTGEITLEHASLIEIGKIMREDRVHKRRVSQREEATRLGCSMAEWSRIERGREPETPEGSAALTKRLEELGL